MKNTSCHCVSSSSQPFAFEVNSDLRPLRFKCYDDDDDEARAQGPGSRDQEPGTRDKGFDDDDDDDDD